MGKHGLVKLDWTTEWFWIQGGLEKNAVSVSTDSSSAFLSHLGVEAELNNGSHGLSQVVRREHEAGTNTDFHFCYTFSADGEAGRRNCARSCSRRRLLVQVKGSVTSGLTVFELALDRTKLDCLSIRRRLSSGRPCGRPHTVYRVEKSSSGRYLRIDRVDHAALAVVAVCLGAVHPDCLGRVIDGDCEGR